MAVPSSPINALSHLYWEQGPVLTNGPWGFVALWLKRERKNDALFFWNQAQEFHTASEGMSLESAPLLHYYCFMNATKALLVAKGLPFDPHHGVKANNLRTPRAKKSLSNEGIRIGNRGILPAFSSYLGELEPDRTHTMQEVLFNLPYVHRTYCLTYTNQQDLFIPLLNGEFVVDQATMQAYFRAESCPLTSLMLDTSNVFLRALFEIHEVGTRVWFVH
jgi:hypothetical protein